MNAWFASHWHRWWFRLIFVIIGLAAGLGIAMAVHHFFGQIGLAIGTWAWLALWHSRSRARKQQQSQEQEVHDELRERAAWEDSVIEKLRERFGDRVIGVRQVYDKISPGLSAMCYDITFSGRQEPERWYPQSHDEWLRVK